MPAAAASSERGRQTFFWLIQRYALPRADWELDYAEMVQVGAGDGLAA